MSVTPAAWRSSVAGALGFERNIVASSLALLLIALGENLWKRFMAKYLEALGAPVIAIGLFGTCRDVLDGVYQYPGGWISDRYGRRRALLIFVALSIVGYVIYGLAPTWPMLFAGLLFVRAWSSMGNPSLFALVGDVLPRQRRTIGFTMQSMLKRLPMAVAPALGGLAIAAYGLRTGVQMCLLATVVLALITVAVVSRLNVGTVPGQQFTDIAGIWCSLPSDLRWLLLSDTLIRTCEGLVDVFLVLYAFNVIGVSAPRYGLLVGVQMATSIIGYIPAAHVADRLGRKPVLLASAVAFALFPVCMTLATDSVTLFLAFVVGGLRELGDPARKALVVDFVVPSLRGRAVALYSLLRMVGVAPAAFIGGLLWTLSPALPFWTAGAIGVAGVILLAVTVDERSLSAT